MATSLKIGVKSKLTDAEVLNIINQFALDLLNQNSVNQVLDGVIENVISHLDFSDCVIYLWDENHKLLIQHAALGHKETLQIKGANPAFLNIQQGIVGRAARNQAVQLINDTSKDFDYIEDGETRLSELAVPLVCDGQLIGVLDSEHPNKDYYTGQHVKLLTTIASMVSVKIVQAKSFDELRKKQTSFNLIHDNTNDLIFLVSVEENGVFRYESVNKSYKKLLGLKPEELIGKTVDDVWDPQSAEFIKAQFNILIEEKKGISYRFFTNAVHGNIEVQSKINPIFDEFGKVINITGVARNLSEIKAKEKDLQETKDQYKILFHSSPDAILIHDDKSVIDVNQAFLHQFGYYERTEIVGKNAFESLVDVESKKIIAQKRSEATPGSPIHIPCIKLLRKDGSFLYSETHIAEIKIKGKSHLQIISRDITDRIRSEQAIKSSQERLQVVANLSHLGSFEWDLENKQLYWEPELNRILDLEEGSEINRIKHFHSVLHPDDREHVIQSFSKAIHRSNTKNLWRVQFRIISQKGKTKHLNSYSTVLRNKEGRVFTIIGACKDITEQIESQKENNRLLDNLKKSEDKFRSLFEDALDPILLFSVTAGFIGCNKATLKLLGLTNKEQMIGKQLEDFSPKFQPDGLLSSQKRQVMNKIGYSNGSNRFEWWLQSAQNMSLSVEVNMVSTTMNEEPILLVQWRDITMRKESEEALRKSEERLRQIVNLVPHFIFAKDVNGKFLLVNKALTKVYNSTIKGLIGKTDADFNDNKEEVEQFRQKDLEVINSGKPRSNIEEIITNSKGEKRILSTTKIPFTSSDSMVPAVLGISVDITEKVNKQEELEELLKVTNDQNARLQNFAHIVSHDIRSHSANITSLVNFIGKSKNESEQSILFGMLRTSTGKLDETIHNLNEVISVNKRLNLPLERLSLRVAIRNTMQVLNQDIRKSGVKIIIDLDGKEYVKAVPAYLDSIILNLMSNAIKYKSPKREPVLKISSKVEDDYRVLFFDDNGLGIDTVKNKDKLFGMYKTFHENEEAKGFGLFITKNQVEAMDGKIELESKVDAGTTFKVYFNENN